MIWLSRVWQVSYKNLSERVLKLTVCDIDRLRRHNVIGSVVFPLRGREDELAGRKLFTSLRLEHADAVVDAVSSNERCYSSSTVPCLVVRQFSKKDKQPMGSDAQLAAPGESKYNCSSSAYYTYEHFVMTYKVKATRRRASRPGLYEVDYHDYPPHYATSGGLRVAMQRKLPPFFIVYFL